MLHLCRKDRALSLVQLDAVVGWKQMTMAVERHHDRSVAKARLHRLRW